MKGISLFLYSKMRKGAVSMGYLIAFGVGLTVTVVFTFLVTEYVLENQ